MVVKTLCLYLCMIINQQKQNSMKTFRIEFQDKDGNELFIKVIEETHLSYAMIFARTYLATTTWCDAVNYVITELN